VELVIRLLGCLLLCEVFALYALHRDASHFAPPSVRGPVLP
jgi:hypothetical protein